MRKRNLLAATVSTLMLATMVAAPLTAAAATGTASVGFTATDPQIDDKPTDGNLKDFTSLNLGFGEQEISSMTKLYLSTDTVKVTTADLNYTGLIVTNNSGGTKGYSVTAALGNFKESNGTTDALPGSILTLKKATDGTYPMPNVSTQTDTPTMTDTHAFQQGGGAQEMSKAAVGVGKGAWGFKWSGELNVPGGTATPGAKTGVMTWTIQIVS